MKSPKLVIPVVLFLFVSCQQTPENRQKKQAHNNIHPAKQKKAHTKSQTTAELVSTYPCAILYVADTLKINAIKTKMNEEDFYTAADDHVWYLAQAREFLEKQNLKVVETQKSRIILRGKNDKSTQIDIPKKEWTALYLCDGINPPVEADMTMVEEEYKKFVRQTK